MNFKTITPEKAGISSKNVLNFIKTLESYNACTHSIIMAKGENIFAEMYYKPFHKDFKHRMYSVSKSFVSIAVGMAADDGLLSLDDKFVDYFSEYLNEYTDDKLRECTIKDFLTMETSMQCGIWWFGTGTKDRTEVYFRKPSDKICGTLFEYDSPGSYMLGVIVEKVTGKPFLEYIKEKALLEMGFSPDAYCLKVPGGHSFGDSGVMCTARDLLIFARFVMNKGKWNSKQYMSREYLEAATSKLVDNSAMGHTAFEDFGYGYLIWMAPDNGFAFVGMGDQFAICIPEKDFIFIINSDNQSYSPTTRTILYHELYKGIVRCMSDKELPEDEKSYEELCRHIEGGELFHLTENRDNPFVNEINGKVYELESNPMNIEYVRFDFEGKKGTLSYKNKQGEKKLVFGIGYNEFGKFPEEGYSDMVATEFEPGNYYDCACSADWAEDKKLRIKVQIIDKYFGNAGFVFSFKDSRISIYMTKAAENFLNEYEGIAVGKVK